MKKTIPLLLALALIFSLASCGTKTGTDAGADEPPVTANDDVNDNEAGTTAEDDTAKKAKEEAAKKAAEAEAAKKAEEEEVKKAAEEEARKKAEEEAAKKAAEEEARKKAEEEAAKKAAEEEARKKAEEEAAKKAAEEEARKKAEEEAAKKAAEEEARKKAEEEAAKKAAEEEALKKAEEEAAKKAAEEEAARKAEEEAAKKAEEEQNSEEQETPTPPSDGLIVPGFGGIGGLGGNNSSEDTPKAQLGDASALVSVLENVLEGNTGDLTLDARALTDSDYWNITNWFPGLTVADGTKAAAATPGISSSAHAVILFEAAEGVDAEAFASELESHADPRWQICTAAESVQYKVCGSRILFVMSSTEIADAVIAAFNG